MLSLEDQIERIADAAFAQTAPVDWTSPARPGGPTDRRRLLVLGAAAVLGLALIGGLIAVVDGDSPSPDIPAVDSAVVPVTTQPTATTIPPPTENTAASTIPTTSPAVVAAPPATGATGIDPGSPIVAIETDGDAVFLTTEDAQPELLFDGQDPKAASDLGDGPNLVERVTIAADQSIAYIGLCCAPSVGTILAAHPPAPAPSAALPIYGFAPTLNPSATLLATALPGSISVTDAVTGVTMTLDEFSGDPWGTTHDLVWLDDTTLAVLNRLETGWTLTIITTDGSSLQAGPTRGFATVSAFADLRFAGTAIGGEIAMHNAGTDRVLSGTLDEYGNLNGGRASSLQMLTLPGAALSAWYSNPDELLWVDSSHALRSGDLTIPGQFTWARR